MIDASHLKKKKGLQTDKFKGICEAFLALHVVQHHAQKNIPFKRPGTCLLRPLVI